eukprot:1140470-Pelagomonas_calceolata.AAC.1
MATFPHGTRAPAQSFQVIVWKEPWANFNSLRAKPLHYLTYYMKKKHFSLPSWYFYPVKAHYAHGPAMSLCTMHMDS